MADDIDGLRAQVAGLEQELARIRAERVALGNEAKDLKGQLAQAQAAQEQAQAAMKALETRAAGVDAIGENAAKAQARVSELEGQLSQAQAAAAREVAMADRGLPKEARDYFGFQFQQQSAADPKADFDTFLAASLDTPIAKAFLGAKPPDAAPTTPPAPQASPPAPGQPPAAPQAPTQPAPTGLPSTRQGVVPPPQPAGEYVPGSVIKSAAENAVKFAASKGIKLNNPERFGLPAEPPAKP